MTKQELQKELKEKVKAGVKPSDLKKLKRSKSVGDIPKAPPLPNSLNRSKSAEELVTSPETIEKLETKISVLELKLETQARELVEKDTEKALFAEQLKQKQQEIEAMREQLETSPNLLDSSLIARHQNLKDWFTQYQKSKKLDSELSENIDQASTELINQDQAITSLRAENGKLKQTNQSLQKDLKLSQRLAELRKEPFSNKDTWPQLPFNWITFALTIFALWIWTTPTKNYD